MRDSDDPNPKSKNLTIEEITKLNEERKREFLVFSL